MEGDPDANLGSMEDRGSPAEASARASPTTSVDEVPLYPVPSSITRLRPPSRDSNASDSSGSADTARSLRMFDDLHISTRSGVSPSSHIEQPDHAVDTEAQNGASRPAVSSADWQKWLSTRQASEMEDNGPSSSQSSRESAGAFVTSPDAAIGHTPSEWFDIMARETHAPSQERNDGTQTWGAAVTSGRMKDEKQPAADAGQTAPSGKQSSGSKRAYPATPKAERIKQVAAL